VSEIPNWALDMALGFNVGAWTMFLWMRLLRWWDADV
jgi:hypothetical protein